MSASLNSLNELDIDAHLNSLSHFPAWLVQAKRESWQRFLSLPEPTRKDESWRFATIKHLSLKDYGLPSASLATDREAIISQSNWVTDFSAKLIFANDHCLLQEPSTDNTVSLLTWDAILRNPDVTIGGRKGVDCLQDYFIPKTTDLGSDKFVNLQAALGSNGVFLYVPDGTEIDAPFVVYHWLSGKGTLSFPRMVVLAGKNARVNLVELFLSEEEVMEQFAFASACICAENGAKVSYQAVQAYNKQSRCCQLNTVHAERDAHVSTVNVNLGSQYMRHEHHSYLAGTGSHVDTDSLSVPNEDQEFDQRTLQTHKAPHCRSDLLFKNALLDQGRTIFSGLIRVEEGAQQTDAYQTNRNLLLSSTANANSLPGLEIHANDVKCSHGATSAQLDENDIFYFLARGIPRSVARQLMTFGFFEEILEKLDTSLAERTREQIAQKF